MDLRYAVGPRVLSLNGDRSGCTWWRIERPFEELARQGYQYAAYAGKDEAGVEDIVQNYEVVVLPRMSWTSKDRHHAERWANALHRAGVAIIGEYDDDLLSPQINWRLKHTTLADLDYPELERRRLDRLHALTIADGFTVSSQRLATILRSLVDPKPVVVVPNAIDVRYWRETIRKAPRIVPPLTIGWAGGSRPEDDLEPLSWAWGQIAQRYPAVTFVVYGHQSGVLGQYVPGYRIRRIPWHPIELYPMPFVNIDIGCAAVSDAPFNAAKTPIKVWEYALGGAPAVATPTLYGQAIEDGVDGLLAETADEWHAALRRLVESKQLRRDLRAQQLIRIRARHSLATEAWRWPTGWSQIVNDFRARRRLALSGIIEVRKSVPA